MGYSSAKYSVSRDNMLVLLQLRGRNPDIEDPLAVEAVQLLQLLFLGSFRFRPPGGGLLRRAAGVDGAGGLTFFLLKQVE